MITKITCRYSFEVLDFHCNEFGFTFNIGVSYLGIEDINDGRDEIISNAFEDIAYKKIDILYNIYATNIVNHIRLI